ncbi:MAG: SPFH domain-containing protein [Lachnospiraceae bacterium]|nr:SPFH domain-containing protein [Lachnospiraceae bacterium]
MALGMDIIKIIKYEGPNTNEVLVWKHPAENFNTTSQLIVHESQTAILFRDGQALDMFGPGRHTLETENIPLLRRIINIPTGGKTPFRCEVYFINKVDVLDVLWGTSQPMPIQDPVYHIILPVRANGQFGLHITNSRQLLVRLIGTTSDLTKKRVAELFRGILMSKAKNLIADLITENQISFVEIHSHLNEISDRIKEQVSPLYADYGMEIINFFVNSISVPENDPGYIQIRSALAKAKETELLAKGEKAQMDILGYNYQQKRTFDMLDKAAQNEGGGSGVIGAGIGMGMGVGIGNMVGSAVGNAMDSAGIGGALFSDTPKARSSYSGQIHCPSCRTLLPQGARFCFECGTKIAEKCPECGAQLPSGAKFCLECGKKI